MNEQITGTKLSIWRVRRHGLVALVVAALLFLAGATARAQLGDGSVRFSTVVGFVPGQTLRVTVFNPDETGQSPESKPIQIKIALLNSRGELLHETAEADIPAGGFRSFDLNRDDIPLAGEPRTGRLEVRVEVVLKVARQNGGGNSYTGATQINAGTLSIGTLQLIDNDSGKTTAALLLPAVQAPREAASRH